MRARQVLCLTWGLIAIPLAVCGQRAVGVVASVTGEATALSPKVKAAAAVRSLDWLDEGVRIEVRPKSTMRLILLNGRTYELSAGAKATIGAAGLTSVNAQVHEGKSLPPIPRLAPIADASADVAGGTAIRGPRVKNLYPNRVWALATRVKLNFAPVSNALNYSVVLEDENRKVLVRVTTPTTSVDVPADALKPGSRYSWRVRALGDSGVLGEGSATFVTVSEEDQARRSAFDAAVSTEDEAMRLALIARVDQQIGLLAEACDEFEAALKLRPSDTELQSALAAAKVALDAARNP
jgi:hypothetical protein